MILTPESSPQVSRHENKIYLVFMWIRRSHWDSPGKGDTLELLPQLQNETVALRMGTFAMRGKDKPRKVCPASRQLGLPKLGGNVLSHTTGDLTRVEKRMYFPRSTNAVTRGVGEESSTESKPHQEPIHNLFRQ